MRLGCGRRHDSTVASSENGLQAGQQLVATGDRNLGVFGDCGNQVGDMVLAGEQQTDQIAVELQFAVAQAIEDILDDVCETHHLVKTEQAAGALDGMRAAKKGIQVVFQAAAVLCTQQDCLHLGEEFPGLFHEGSECLREVFGGVAHGMFLADSVAEMNRGSPSTPPRLRQIDQAQNARRMIDEAHALARIAFGDQHQLQTGRIDLGNAAQVDLDFVGSAHDVRQSGLDFGDLIDGQFARPGSAAPSARCAR
jgi:hypothetical protein